MRVCLRLPWYVERDPPTPTADDGGAEGRRYPPSLDFVYRTAVDALAAQERTLSSLDTKAGVLIGATAAAVGLIASSGGSPSSLFSLHPTLGSVSLLLLALAFGSLLGTVLVRASIEYPNIPGLVRRASEPEDRIKELSLAGLQEARLHNRRQRIWKARLLLLGQCLLGAFIVVVVLFKLSDLGMPGPDWVQLLRR